MSNENSGAGGPPSGQTTASRPSRSRVAWWLGILVLMVLAGGAVFFWQQYTSASTGEPAAVAMPPPEVTVANPVYKEIVEWDEYTGQFAAVDWVDVRARVSGYIESIHFTDGQLVNAGDLLFVIDPRPFQ